MTELQRPNLSKRIPMKKILFGIFILALFGISVVMYNEYFHNKNKLEVPKTISGNAYNGKRLYTLYCLTCHGENGAGIKKMGPALSTPQYLKTTSDRQIWTTTAFGRKGTRMGPSLKGLDGARQLKKEDITDIVSYIRSLQSHKE